MSNGMNETQLVDQSIDLMKKAARRINELESEVVQLRAQKMAAADVSRIKAEAIDEAVAYISRRLDEKQNICVSEGQKTIMQHKIDVLVALKNFARQYK